MITTRVFGFVCLFLGLLWGVPSFPASASDPSQLRLLLVQKHLFEERFELLLQGRQVQIRLTRSADSETDVFDTLAVQAVGVARAILEWDSSYHSLLLRQPLDRKNWAQITLNLWDVEQYGRGALDWDGLMGRVRYQDSLPARPLPPAHPPFPVPDNRAPFPTNTSENYRKASKLTGGLNLFGEKEEIALGRQFAQEIEAELELINDRYVRDYIQQMGGRLVEHSLRPHLEYRFQVVNDSEINAFAGPGGFIYINRGLIEAAETESRLAAVVAHEISHVVARHSVRSLSKDLLLSGLLEMGSALLGSDHSVWRGVIEAGGGFAVFFGMMKYSRRYERQADLLGLHTLYRAGYDPRAMVHFFEQLLELERSEPSRLERLFSSHPPIRERIHLMDQELPYLPAYPQWRKDRPEFQDLRKYLLSLPPAPGERVLQRSAPVPAPVLCRRLRVEGNQQWTDTGIDVRAGEQWRIRAVGTIRWKKSDASTGTGPNGFPKKGFFKPISKVNTGALIARVGADSYDYLLIGSEALLEVEQAGRLYLGINDDNVSDNSGFFEVVLERLPPR